MKVFGGPLVCPTNGCESVLSSPYASLFGQPLTLFGMGAYGAVAALAVAYGRAAAGSGPEAAASQRILLAALAAGAAALGTTSAVLMWVTARTGHVLQPMKLAGVAPAGDKALTG